MDRWRNFRDPVVLCVLFSDYESSSIFSRFSLFTERDREREMKEMWGFCNEFGR